MNIYRVELDGETITVAARNTLEANELVLCHVWRSQGIAGVKELVDGERWAEEYLKMEFIHKLDIEEFVKMSHPNSLVGSVDWLEALIDIPQVIGSTEF